MADINKLIEEAKKVHPNFAEAEAVVKLSHRTGDALEAMRERAGLSQAELGKKLGISAARVSQLETGLLRHAISLKMLARFAYACGESVELVVSGEPKTAGDDPRWMLVSDALAGLRAEVAGLRTDMASRSGSETASEETRLAELKRRKLLVKEEITRMRDRESSN